MLLVAILHLAAYWATFSASNFPAPSSSPLDARPTAFEWVFISSPRATEPVRTHSADLAVHPRVTAATPKSLAAPLTVPDNSSTDRAPDKSATDWNSELELVAKSTAEPDRSDPRRTFSAPRRTAPTPKAPTFDWDPVHTHRVEIAPEGGMIIHLSDKCVMVFMPLPFAACGIGKKEANGHLLEHMHDAPSIDEAPSVPAAPVP